MSVKETNENAYGLETWIAVVKQISNNGEKVIEDFNQVPVNLFLTFKQALVVTGCFLKILDEEGKLEVRNIIVRHEPSLLANYDVHFESFYKENDLKTKQITQEKQ